jgi:hypothetical protein
LNTETTKKVIRVGGAMSDEVLRGFMKAVKPEEVATKTGRGSSDLWPRMVGLFIESGNPMMEIDYKAMDRKWAAVAQSLRVALKGTKAENGEPLSTVAYVSVSKADETIYLRRRPVEGEAGPGRPRKS